MDIKELEDAGMDEEPKSDTQTELDRFRQAWLSEVGRNNRKPGDRPTADASGKHQSAAVEGAPTIRPTAPASRQKEDYSEDVEPRAYHDLPDEEERLQLGRSGQDQDRDPHKEPSSALEHYEHAVEKETRGQLGDSIQHYRKAFRLDAGVQETYKKKHFPASSFHKPRPSKPNPSNAAPTIPNPAHHSRSAGGTGLSNSLKQLLEDFAALRIEAAPPETNLSSPKRSFLAELPEEILDQILTTLALTDVAALARVAQVCKRLAYVVITEQSIWKRVVMGKEFGLMAMHYDYACDVGGLPLENQKPRYLESYERDDRTEHVPTPEEKDAMFATITNDLLHTLYADSWRQMFRSRPRIRFNGCYISTVNYTRAGANSTNTLSWGAPVHVVTYYRYLRFFRDGTAISLLTTSEPTDVVHHLIKDNLHNHHGNTLPSSVMKDALRGRWRISGPASSAVDPLTDSPEVEGDVHVETEGVVPKYTYKMLFALAHAGKGARNNKLAWKNFWSHNRLTDDWGEFHLKNDRAFYWSRVKSYGIGY